MMIPTRLSINLAVSVALTAGFLLPGQAAAVEVYKWMDEQGIVHYSGSPPPEAVTEFATLEFPNEYDAPSESENHHLAMLQVAKELEKSRLAREKIRAEQEALERQRSQRIMAIPPAYEDGAYYPLYPYATGFFHRPFFPHFKFFPHDPRLGLINRGIFVPDVKFRPFQGFDPAARARTIGGEAFAR